MKCQKVVTLIYILIILIQTLKSKTSFKAENGYIKNIASGQKSSEIMIFYFSHKTDIGYLKAHVPHVAKNIYFSLQFIQNKSPIARFSFGADSKKASL